MSKVTAIVLSAGRGKRMGSDIPKQYLLIGDKPVIYYTLKAFEASAVDQVILVTGAEDIDDCREKIVSAYGFHKVSRIVAGGAERFDSVYRGLIAAEGSDYVLIHDGARCMITPDLIDRNIRCVMGKKACVTAVRSKDTIKLSDAEGYVASTPPRKDCWIIQTPQSFAYDQILAAYEAREAAGDDSVTDDAMVMERYGRGRIYLLEGDYSNIKITTPEDLAIAERYLC